MSRALPRAFGKMGSPTEIGYESIRYPENPALLKNYVAKIEKISVKCKFPSWPEWRPPFLSTFSQFTVCPSFLQIIVCPFVPVNHRLPSLPAIHRPYPEALEALLGHFFKESEDILPRHPWQSPFCAYRMKMAKDGELPEGRTGTPPSRRTTDVTY